MNRARKICSTVVFVLTLFAVTLMSAQPVAAAGVSGKNHQQGALPDMSVIDAMDVHGPVLLKERVGGVDVVIGWEQGSLFVYEDGVLVDVETGFDVLGRPAFRTPNMNGSFGHGDDSLIVNITVTGQPPERISSIGGVTSDGQTAIASALVLVEPPRPARIRCVIRRTTVKTEALAIATVAGRLAVVLLPTETRSSFSNDVICHDFSKVPHDLCGTFSSLI